MKINSKFLIQQKNMKKFGLELDDKLEELIVQKNFFIEKTTLKLRLMLTMTCL